MKKLKSILRAMGLTKRIKNLRKSFNYTIQKRVNGKTYLIPKIYDTVFVDSEKWMDEVLSKLFEETSGVFLDVGVNIGQTLIKGS